MTEIYASDDLLSLVVASLRAPGATDAGDQVFRPGDWPTQATAYPRLKVRITRETKQSLARSGPPEFTVLTNVRIVAEVSAPAQVSDAGAEAAEAQLWAIYHQVERAVINSYPLTSAIQQIASVNAQLDYTSDGETHLAGIQVDLALEWFQGPEAFAPIAADPLETVDVDVSTFRPVGFSADLQP